MPTASQLELKRLLELTARMGNDPLLTQASSGNSSVKLDGVLWIKASGKWMANAMHDDILIPLELKDVTDCLRRGLDPAERFPSASLETAMHAVLLHRVVLHVHSVTTIAWAVRRDARMQLQARLGGLRWQWVPYIASGLPLSREIEHALSTYPDADVFILGNHGLVIGGDDAKKVEDLLIEVQRRLDIRPRPAPRANYSVLTEICSDSQWDLPDDDGVHALSTDVISQTILAGGLLYPCQAIFSGSGTSDLFRPIPYHDHREARYRNWPFLIVEGLGVVINRSARPAEVAMISGLAHVIQRLSASAPIRYLTQAELTGLSGQVVYRYRELANVSQSGGGSSHSGL
jgi:rhamnose utilization protein RhaD (predicted bifunctional aldolase and dehydrogenase)